jgi:predicted PurR-regulated permease PerM
MTALINNVSQYQYGNKIKNKIHKISQTENKNDTILNCFFFHHFSRMSGTTEQSIFSTFNNTVNLVHVILMTYFFWHKSQIYHLIFDIS